MNREAKRYTVQRRNTNKNKMTSGHRWKLNGHRINELPIKLNIAAAAAAASRGTYYKVELAIVRSNNSILTSKRTEAGDELHKIRENIDHCILSLA